MKFLHDTCLVGQDGLGNGLLWKVPRLDGLYTWRSSLKMYTIIQVFRES